MSMYHVLTPAQFHAREFHASKINILFTFDDGYQSWIDVCLPVLTSYNIHGLFFINSGLLDVATDQVAVETYMRQQLRIEPKKPLTWNGAQVLVDAGHTIGGHTVSHPDLTTLPLAGALKEIQKDKQVLELRLGVVVTDFAYPFGRKKKL